jgi:hypothetical protein
MSYDFKSVLQIIALTGEISSQIKDLVESAIQIHIYWRIQVWKRLGIVNNLWTRFIIFYPFPKLFRSHVAVGIRIRKSIVRFWSGISNKNACVILHFEVIFADLLSSFSKNIRILDNWFLSDSSAKFALESVHHIWSIIIFNTCQFTVQSL